MYKTFKKILRKYHKGNSTLTESSFIELFFNEMQQDGISTKDISADIDLGKRLFSNIKKKTTLTTIPNHFKIKHTVISTCCILLVVGITILFNINDTYPHYVVHQTNKTNLEMIVLQDSSVVYLNVGSTLKHLSDFSDNHREVYLQGEAFFIVNKDTTLPFIVKTRDLKTTVLGTSFNINDLNKNATSVSVHTGKVAIESSFGNATLIKNERITLDRERQKLIQENFNSSESNQWINARIQFQDVTLNELSEILARRFNVQIELQDLDYQQKNYRINGDFKADNIEEVLQGIEFIYGIKYIKKSHSKYLLIFKNNV